MTAQTGGDSGDLSDETGVANTALRGRGHDGRWCVSARCIASGDPYVFVECCSSKCERFYEELSRLMFGFLEVEGARNLAWPRLESCGLSCLRLGSQPHNSSRPRNLHFKLV
jgi:hypothetical protein